MTRKIERVTFFTLGTLALAICLSGSCGGDKDHKATEQKSQARSVIILAVDGLRADSLGCYGGTTETPALDALAGESVRFDQAWAQAPGMQASLASLLTGLYPTTHGLVEAGDHLVPEANTLAESLSTAGLKTAAFIQGAKGGGSFGLDQGFGQYTVGPKPGRAGLSWLDEHPGEDVFLLIAGWSAGRLETTDADSGVTAPEGFAQRLQQALTSETPDSLNDEDLNYARAAYAAHVTRIDAAIGQFIDQLRSSGRLDTSALVLVGTSGFALSEHGDLINDSLYPAVTQVPLMIRMPGAPAKTIDTVVEVLDLMPTLIEVAGAIFPDGLQGSSLMPIIGGTSNPPYIAFSESDRDGGMTSVVMNGMQLVTTVEQTSLFDLSADPMALADLAQEFPERATVLSEHLGAWSKMVAAASLDPDRKIEDLDDDTLDQLRSLGYIQ
ncbi:MAG: sulfatase [Acidobacteria bacterium]|nr:sulfatase [Acidobacteriota bacterium]